MDTISIENFIKLLKAPIGPVVIDVRSGATFASAGGVIPGAVHRGADAVDGWASDLELARPIVVYCAHGGETSQGVASALREKGHPAQVLEGGFGVGGKWQCDCTEARHLVSMGDARAAQD